MIKALVIYETIPESTDIYLLDFTPDEWEIVKKTNRKYLNQSDNSLDIDNALIWLSEYLTKESALSESEIPVLNGVNFFIIHTGFIL